MSEVLQAGCRFFNLRVEKLVDTVEIGHKHVMHKYLCKCDCGNEIEVFQGELISGHIKSCGCRSNSRKQHLKYDLTGQRFGRLQVLRQAPTFWSDSGKSRMVRWECKCDCGNMVVVNSRALRMGSTQSCGCYHKECLSEKLTDDLMGKKFGHLTVVERAGSYHKANRKTGVMAMWKCRCDCGNEIITTGYSLKCGDTVSCGCMKTSFAEDVVNDYLQLVGYIENDNYFREKTFSDLIGVGGGFLRFDFVVFVGNNIVCVECQGEQHYKSVNYFGGDNQFEIRKQNDEIKRQWCKKKNYILLEVPYTLHTSDEIQNYLAELMNRVSE